MDGGDSMPVPQAFRSLLDDEADGTDLEVAFCQVAAERTG
jgi:hypothetical protein